MVDTNKSTDIFFLAIFSDDDRRNGANKIQKEAAQLKRHFNKLAKDCDLEFDSPFNALSGMADVLRADPEMLILDVASFVKAYPDISQQQLYCLLAVRGDLDEKDSKEYSLQGAEERQVKTDSIFAKVTAVGAGGSTMAKVAMVAKVANVVAQKTKETNLNPFGDDF